MASKLLGLDLKSILIVMLLAVVVLMLPIDTVEPFEITYQAPVLKEYQSPVQVEKNNTRYSATIGVVDIYDIGFMKKNQNEWVTGSFIAEEPIWLSVHDSKNYINITKNIKPVWTTWSTHAYAEDFTFEPPPDTWYYVVIKPDKPTKLSLKLTVHWYETEYETRYKTENEIYYKTEYKTIKKPLYKVLLS